MSKIALTMPQSFLAGCAIGLVVVCLRRLFAISDEDVSVFTFDEYVKSTFFSGAVVLAAVSLWNQ